VASGQWSVARKHRDSRGEQIVPYPGRYNSMSFRQAELARHEEPAVPLEVTDGSREKQVPQPAQWEDSE